MEQLWFSSPAQLPWELLLFFSTCKLIYLCYGVCYVHQGVILYTVNRRSICSAERDLKTDHRNESICPGYSLMSQCWSLRYLANINLLSNIQNKSGFCTWGLVASFHFHFQIQEKYYDL